MSKAYQGNEPFLFVSYAHADRAQVMIHIENLQRSACNIWYDDGIHSGTSWSADIAEHLATANCVLFFVSAASICSHYVQSEIHYAISKSKTVIPVFLEEVSLPPALELLLGQTQYVFAYNRSPVDVRKQLSDELPSEVFHRAGDPFHVGKNNLFFLEKRETPINFGRFEGEMRRSFCFYAENAEHIQRELWKFAEPGPFDMFINLLNCQLVEDKYFAESNDILIISVSLSFSGKDTVLVPDVDLFLTFALTDIDCPSPKPHYLTCRYEISPEESSTTGKNLIKQVISSLDPSATFEV